MQSFLLFKYINLYWFSYIVLSRRFAACNLERTISRVSRWFVNSRKHRTYENSNICRLHCIERKHDIEIFAKLPSFLIRFVFISFIFLLFTTQILNIVGGDFWQYNKVVRFSCASIHTILIPTDDRKTYYTPASAVLNFTFSWSSSLATQIFPCIPCFHSYAFGCCCIRRFEKMR